LIRKVWPFPCLISPWRFRLIVELTSLELNKLEIQLACVTTDAGKISLILLGECSNLSPISLLLGRKTNWNIRVLINWMKVALVLNFLLRNPSKCLAQKPMVSNFMFIQFSKRTWMHKGKNFQRRITGNIFSLCCSLVKFYFNLLDCRLTIFTSSPNLSGQTKLEGLQIHIQKVQYALIPPKMNVFYTTYDVFINLLSNCECSFKVASHATGILSNNFKIFSFA
jgi:hypothetical protein